MSSGFASSKIHELRFVQEFNNKIKEMKINVPFNLILKDSSGNESKLFKNIVGARVLKDKKNLSPEKKINMMETDEKTSKADIVLFDTEGKSVVFISHKSDKRINGKETGEGIHAQFMHAGTNKKFKSEKAYQELQNFKRKLLRISKKMTNTTYCFPVLANGSPLTTWDYVNNEDIVNIAIFGVNFGSSRYGRHNCNILLNGDPEINIDENNNVVLSSTSHSILNGAPLPSKYFNKNDINPKSQRIIFRTINAKNTKVTIKIDNTIYTIKGLNIWVIFRNQASGNAIQIDTLLKNPSLLSKDICSLDVENVESRKISKKITKSIFDKISKESKAVEKREQKMKNELMKRKYMIDKMKKTKK